MRKLNLTLAAVAAPAAIAGLALAGASAASAGVSPAVHYTQAGAEATSGYFTNELGTYFTHISGYVGSNATTSLENLAPGTSNGAGVALCNQTTGSAVRAGDVYEGSGLMNVVAADGTLSAPTPPGGFNDPCSNGATLPVFQTLFTDVPVTDTIAVQILTDPHHAFNGRHAGQVVFAAEDVTANPGVWVQSDCLSGSHVFNEADAGVISDTQSMSVPADNLLAVFAHLGLTSVTPGGAAVHGSFQSNSHWTVYPVVATSNGLASGSKLLVPGAFSQDHFVENSGKPDRMSMALQYLLIVTFCGVVCAVGLWVIDRL